MPTQKKTQTSERFFKKKPSTERRKKKTKIIQDMIKKDSKEGEKKLANAQKLIVDSAKLVVRAKGRIKGGPEEAEKMRKRVTNLFFGSDYGVADWSNRQKSGGRDYSSEWVDNEGGTDKEENLGKVTAPDCGFFDEKEFEDMKDSEQRLPPSKQELYKTELCRSWMENQTCRYATKCQFAHGTDELRPVKRHPKYKTEICKTFHSYGTCPYGRRCRFVHFPQYEASVEKKDPEFKRPKRLPFFRTIPIMWNILI
eukprot:TRINITY_DN10634_c0_g1_i1.p1 TRINITY_DN10634_c0_g1~~TRINITY_DN10634_c0_g1_i1.p1  ORF type:complete len:254 (-),score=54.49 TRINITY_DN10634_c0_g1_i1:100-861(-)